jgi:hypothetical protein
MRQKAKRVFVVIALVLAFSMTLTFPVFAGIRTTVLDSSSLEDVSLWNNLSNDVVVENGELIFPNNSTPYTRFISKDAGKTNTGLGYVARIACKMQFTQLPENEEFAVAFGLSDIESGMGEAGNVEIIFSNNGGIKVEIVAYEEIDVPIVLSAAKSVGASMNKAFNFNAEIGENGTLKVEVNGKTVYSGNIPVTGEGKIGFVQTKSCGVKVSNILANLGDYDRPQNTNIVETFDNGTMNTAVLSSRVIGIVKKNIINRRACIEEYNANNVFMFENCGSFYLGTVYSYSNFELSFDVPYFKVKGVVDENGKEISVGTGNFVLSFGAPLTDYSRYGYEDAVGAIVFDQGIVYSYFDRTIKNSNPYWKEDQPFSVKLKVVDKHVTVSIKKLEDAEFETMLEFDLPSMQSGKVHFWVPTWVNMAIDNFTVTNLDQDPDLIEVEYKAGTYNWEDYEYTPFERVYKNAGQTGGAGADSGWYWYLMIPAVAVVCGVVLAVISRKKVKKEA